MFQTYFSYTDEYKYRYVAAMWDVIRCVSCWLLAGVLWMVQDGCCDVGGMRWVPTPGPLTSGDQHQWPRVHTRAVTIMIPVIVTSSILGSHYLALSSLALDRTIQLSKYVSHLFHSPGYRRYKPQLKPSPRRCGSRWVKCEHMKI